MALAALRTSPLYRLAAHREFDALFGYLLGNRHGIDGWTQIPSAFRHGGGRTQPALKSGSGAVNKNIYGHINRQSKPQGRSWNPIRAQRLLALKQLLAQPTAWIGWRKPNPQFHIKPSPP